MFEMTIFVICVLGLIGFITVGIYAIGLEIKRSWIEWKERRLEKKNLTRYEWWLERRESSDIYDVVVYDRLLDRRV